jgi:hypothetical protein
MCNETVDHMTHQTRCQSKLMTKPFIPFLKKVLKLVTESKNLRAIGMPGEICTSCSIGTGTKGAWYGAREEAYSGIDLLRTRRARHNRFVR